MFYKRDYLGNYGKETFRLICNELKKNENDNEDKQLVVDAIKKKIVDGIYPEKLW